MRERRPAKSPNPSLGPLCVALPSVPPSCPKFPHGTTRHRILKEGQVALQFRTSGGLLGWRCWGPSRKSPVRCLACPSPYRWWPLLEGRLPLGVPCNGDRAGGWSARCPGRASLCARLSKTPRFANAHAPVPAKVRDKRKARVVAARVPSGLPELLKLLQRPWQIGRGQTRVSGRRRQGAKRACRKHTAPHELEDVMRRRWFEGCVNWRAPRIHGENRRSCAFCVSRGLILARHKSMGRAKNRCRPGQQVEEVGG